MNKLNQRQISIFMKVFREATLIEIFLISIILFPIIFSSWDSIIKILLPEQNLIRVCLLLIGYIILIVLVIVGKMTTRKDKVTADKLKRLKKLVMNFMSEKEISLASFDKIRSNLPNSNDWTDQLFYKLLEEEIENFSFKRIKNKNGGKFKPGLIISNYEEVDEDIDEKDRLETLKNEVIKFMSEKETSLASFEKIRSNLSNSDDWTDQLFHKLLEKEIETFSFKRIKNKDGGKFKPGLALISIDEEFDEDIDEKNKLEILKRLVIQFMSEKGISLASFEKVRSNLPSSSDWTDQLFHKLLEKEIETFSFKKIKNRNGGKFKPGIRFNFNDEEVDEDIDG